MTIIYKSIMFCVYLVNRNRKNIVCRIIIAKRPYVFTTEIASYRLINPSNIILIINRIYKRFSVRRSVTTSYREIEITDALATPLFRRCRRRRRRRYHSARVRVCSVYRSSCSAGDVLRYCC